MAEKIPTILYKYRDWSNSYHKRVLTENEVYFASPSEFNDPFDCAIPFSYDKKELTEENIFLKSIDILKKKYPKLDVTEIHNLAFSRRNMVFDDRHIEIQNRDRQKSFNRNFAILSLTSKRENFLMWSHYSSSHSGFCIGYNSEKLFEQSQCHFGPVVYTDEFPTFGLFDDTFSHFVKYAFHKAKIWEYEEEYRMLREASKGKILKLTKDTVEEIILGYKMAQSEKFFLLELVANKFPDVKVFDSIIHQKKFKIILNRIR